MKRILPILFAAILLLSAVMHVVQPGAYEPLIPPFIPPLLANILATIAEAVVGIALIIPRYRAWGGLGFMMLMIAFLPLHVWDLLKDNPAMGSQQAAAIRLVIQLVLIYAGWWIWKQYSKRAA